MSKKFTLEYVKQCFKEQKCEMLEKEYKSNRTKMRYKCSCGNISEIVFSKFKRGQRCTECSGSKKHTYEFMKIYFKERGCELLEKKYKNCGTKMNYKCNCGNISKISFDSFKRGSRCKKCSGLEKHTFQFVKNYFKEQKCKLLEKIYVNCMTKMKYICSCGNKSKIRFNDFKNGKRCNVCGIKRMTEKIKGENNWNYNFNLTDEEREAQRSRLNDIEYRKWRTKTYKRDNYTCQKCSQRGGKLNAHHIESWGSNKKLRLKKNNGITFCEYCHKNFHKMYGYKNTNKQQLNKYLCKGKK